MPSQIEMSIANLLNDVQSALEISKECDLFGTLRSVRESIEGAVKQGALFDILPYQERYATLYTAVLLHEADAERRLLQEFLEGKHPGRDASGTWVAAWNAVRALEAQNIDVHDRLQALLGQREALHLTGGQFDPESAQFVGK